jgi:hypothetical protein
MEVRWAKRRLFRVCDCVLLSRGESTGKPLVDEGSANHGTGQPALKTRASSVIRNSPPACPGRRRVVKRSHGRDTFQVRCIPADAGVQTRIFSGVSGEGADGPTRARSH